MMKYCAGPWGPTSYARGQGPPPPSHRTLYICHRSVGPEAPRHTASTFCLFHAEPDRASVQSAHPLHFWCNCAIPEHQRRPKPCHPVSSLHCCSHENRWCACCLRAYIHMCIRTHVHTRISRYPVRSRDVCVCVCVYVRGNDRIANNVDSSSSDFYNDFAMLRA